MANNFHKKYNLKTPTILDIQNRTVLVRVDFNVPLKKIEGKYIVADDKRIQNSLETISFLLENNAKVVLMSHLGRPQKDDGHSSGMSTGTSLKPSSIHNYKYTSYKPTSKYSLSPIALHLQEKYDLPVTFASDCVGKKTEGIVKEADFGSIVLLENLRLHMKEYGPTDSDKSQSFAKNLAKLADVYINEAFSSSHRDHVSMVGVPSLLPSFAGFSLKNEVENLEKLTLNPKRPFAIVIGGAKISDKVGAIENLSNIADIALIGGGVANNFLKAEGIEIHKSYLQDTPADLEKKKINYVQVADHILEDHRQEKLLKDGYIPIPKILYPTDVVAGGVGVLEGGDEDSNVSGDNDLGGETKVGDKTKVSGSAKIPNNEIRKTRKIKTQIIDLTHDMRDTPNDKDIMYLDIGPKTAKLYREILLEAKTIFWNGPMGVFEKEEFSNGTRVVMEAIVEAKKRGAVTVIGGGDTVRAVGMLVSKDRDANKIRNNMNYNLNHSVSQNDESDDNSDPLEDMFDYVSTAGGASLDFLAGKNLAGLDLIEKQ